VQALFPLSGATSLRAFTAAQLDAMTSLALRSHVHGFGIALLFFGPFFLIAGRLIFRSGYFPRPIGVLYQIAGAGYLVNGFCLILAPAFAGTIFNVIVIPVFVGEASFCAWLLLKGVDLERWKARAGAMPAAAAAAALLILASALPMQAHAADPAVSEAKRLLDANRPASAVKLLEKAVAENPKSAVRHFWLGRAYGAAAEEASAFKVMSLARNARDAFESAVRADPNFVDARMALVEYYLMAPGFMGGSVEKARAQATEIRKRDALEGHRAFAQIAVKNKDLGAARSELLAAIREQQASPRPRYYYGVHLMVEEKSYAAAAEQFDAALRIDAGFMPAWFQIGHVAALSGTKLARGEEALRKYLTVRPGDDDPSLHRAHYWLGVIHEKAGRKAEARAQFEAALRLRPTDKSVKEALKRVS
jgi:tetratricopeptide (TPR) repeat protein